MKTNPPFKADHVGSLLRLPELKDARTKFEKGNLSADELKAVEDESITKIVAVQERAGMKGITDGEQRRKFFHVDFLEKFEGVEASHGEYEIKFRGEDKDVSFVPPVLNVTGKISRPKEGIALDDFRFLNSVVSEDSVAKICIPSPSMLHFRGGRDGISKDAYPDMDNFFTDLTHVYQQEIKALYDLGCRYLQLDDTNLAYLCDPEHCERVKALGEDPAELPSLYAKLITDCFKGIPEDMTTAIHLCRGNHASAWAAEGGYAPVADTMFNETGVDAFFLEYDDDRSGSFNPLRFVPKDKTVVLGLISSKVSTLETPEEIITRIKEAGEYIDLDQCCLSPQYGFSSTEVGNDISMQNQFKKLKFVVDVAEEFWGNKSSKASNY